MVAKLIVEDCPNIEFIDLGSSLDEVRANLSAINFNEPGIHILMLQPGVGKSHAIKKYLKKEKSFLIATGSHKLLHGEYDKIGAKHWYGLNNENCSKFKEIKPLLDYHLPIKLICHMKGCNRGKCDYWKQFNTRKAIAPVNYLPTNRVLYSKRGRGFKFGLLVFDEALKDYNTLQFSAEDTEQSISTIQKYEPFYDKRDRLYDPISHLMEQFVEYRGTREIPSIDLANSINVVKNKALNSAIGIKEWDDASAIARFDIYGLRKFLYYYNVYGNIVTYPEPYFYYAIDLALQGVPVVFLDATFDIYAFKILLGRYIYENSVISRSILLGKELGSFNDFRIKVYYSKIEKKETKIYRMDKDNFYYRSGFFKKADGEDILTENGKETVKQLREYIIKSKRKFNSVGIITYKNLVKEFHDLGPTEYFGNLRGSNTIKDVDALFIIGTPVNNTFDVIDGYNNLCLTNYNPKNVERLKYVEKGGKFYVDGWLGPFNEKKPSFLVYDIEDFTGTSSLASALNFMKSKGIVDANFYYPHWEFDANLSESEKYQAVHRARPFENNAEIYVFGDVPDQAKKEFNTKSFDKEQTRVHFTRYGVYPIPLFKLITDAYTENPALTSEDIAKKLRLYKNREKKGGYNSRIVTIIKKGKITLEQIVKMHKIFLKSDLNNEEATIKEIGNLKIPIGLARFFLFYAKYGQYVRVKS